MKGKEYIYVSMKREKRVMQVSFGKEEQKRKRKEKTRMYITEIDFFYAISLLSLFHEANCVRYEYHESS